jgi:hypothetical protein
VGNYSKDENFRRTLLKTISLLIAFTILCAATLNCFADANDTMMHMNHHAMQEGMNDSRISLNLSPEIKQHQLANMRSHVEAVQSIVGFISIGDFEQAARVAHLKLGLTDEMKKMCGMFGNDKFEKLGLAFHKSGDELGNALQTKDVSKSLQALHETIGYCVECHATFRQ